MTDTEDLGKKLVNLEDLKLLQDNTLNITDYAPYNPTNDTPQYWADQGNISIEYKNSNIGLDNNKGHLESIVHSYSNEKYITQIFTTNQNSNSMFNPRMWIRTGLVQYGYNNGEIIFDEVTFNKWDGTNSPDYWPLSTSDKHGWMEVSLGNMTFNNYMDAVSSDKIQLTGSTVYKRGDIFYFHATLSATQAIAANTNINLFSVPSAVCGTISNDFGHGHITSSGNAWFTFSRAINQNVSFIVTGSFIENTK